MLELVDTFASGPNTGAARGIPITLEFVTVAVFACPDLSVPFQLTHLVAAHLLLQIGTAYAVDLHIFPYNMLSNIFKIGS